MSNHNQDNRRIAKNTLFLYIRSMVLMCISLYTSRIVLATLGFTNFGIYSLVGTVVVMFNVFSATFVSSTQRFLNIELGKKDGNVKKVFSAALNVHLGLAGCILILLETIGIYFLNYQLDIPNNRLFAANFVYQFSVATFIINLISLPYNALIISKEKMDVFAYISIYEGLAKLAIVFLIQWSPVDILIYYSFLLFLVAISVRLLYTLYCKKNIQDCVKIKVSDRGLYKSILNFSGWNLMGSGISILTTSGMGIVFNLFNGILINAAKGVADQVNHAVGNFTSNFMTSLKPQIVKSYAAEDYEYMQSLISRGSRFSYYLMAFLIFPLVFEADNILKLWLGNVPLYAVEFVQVILITNLTNAFSTTLDIALSATGKIKYPQICFSVFQFLNIPLACLILWLQFPPYFVYVGSLGLGLITIYIRLYFLSSYKLIDIRNYLKNVLFPIVLMTFSSLLVPICLYKIVEHQGFSVLVINVIIMEVTIFLSIYFWGVNSTERQTLKTVIRNKFHHAK